MTKKIFPGPGTRQVEFETLRQIRYRAKNSYHVISQELLGSQVLSGDFDPDNIKT